MREDIIRILAHFFEIKLFLVFIVSYLIIAFMIAMDRK